MKITLDRTSLDAVKTLYQEYTDKRREISENKKLDRFFIGIYDAYLTEHQRTILEVLDCLGIIYGTDEYGRLVI